MKQGMARRSSVLVRSVLKIEEKARGGKLRARAGSCVRAAAAANAYRKVAIARGGSCERGAAVACAYRKVAIEPRRGEETHIVFFRFSVRFLTRFS